MANTNVKNTNNRRRRDTTRLRRTSAVIPVVSYNANRFGVSVGPVFRFTSFFGEPAIFEYVVMFSLHWNIINKENLRFSYEVGASAPTVKLKKDFKKSLA